MYSYKILLGITGSIAAYKSAYLASRLIQNGYEVQVVATPSALKFMGAATFEGLTGRPVLWDGFERGNSMSHINLVKWTDLTILSPATANTINKLAAGIADNLVTSLFLAHDWKKPYLISPAMNTAMMNHPATRNSINQLKMWGITVLETGFGRLACGDEGYGKMLEPDEIMKIIGQKLSSINLSDPAARKILITSGGTRERIDGAREISNISTGRTGAEIADFFVSKNWEVSYLHSTEAELPQRECEKVSFTDFASLDEILQSLLRKNEYAAVIHLAAVSDYSAESLIVNGSELKVPVTGKIDSNSGEMIIKLRRNHKIVNRIKSYAQNSNPVLVAFKFTVGEEEKSVLPIISRLKQDSGAELVVWNDAGNRVMGRQTNFRIFSDLNDVPVYCPEPIHLAVKLEEYLSEKIKTN